MAVVPAIGSAAVASRWLASPTIQAVVKAGVLRVGTSYAAPSSFKDPKTGQPNGTVILIGREAARRLGVRLDVAVTGWDTIIAGLQARRYDVALAGLFETPARQKVVDFVTFGDEGIAFLVKKDNNKINTPADLDKPGVTIATVTGSGSEQMVKQHFTNATIRSLLSPSGGSGAPPEEVISGRADAAQFDAVLTNAYLERFPMLKVVPKDAFVQPLFPTPVGIAIRKDDPTLKSFLTSVVEDLTARGVLAKYRKMWSTPELLLGQ
jgi:polar amino acid transport system substrate-binding protein